MQNKISFKPIAKIHTEFPTKFGIPRQSGLENTLLSTIVFEPEYRNPDALRGLDGYSYIWLIWQFSESMREEWSPTVRPPRLGGNTRMGVFASRSPFRPNPIGLSCVKIEQIDFTTPQGPVIVVSGADIMDGTPIYDIKPYLPYVDSHPDALGGFSLQSLEPVLDVDFPKDLLIRIPDNLRTGLITVLSQDPRPAYQNESNRIYGFRFNNFDIRFTVENNRLTVCKIVDIY